MGLIGENPKDVYHCHEQDGLKIYLNNIDSGKVTADCAGQFCQKHGYTGEKVRAFYYLRGNTRQVTYSRVLVGVLERDLPAELNEIIHCLSFWNQEGADCYMNNAKKEETYSDFILRCIAADCRVFIEPWGDRFLTGSGGNHVWVSEAESGERILIIHF